MHDRILLSGTEKDRGGERGYTRPKGTSMYVILCRITDSRLDKLGLCSITPAIMMLMTMVMLMDIYMRIHRTPERKSRWGCENIVWKQ